MCNIFSFLQDSSQKYPEKTYVVDKGSEWTYSSVFQKVTALAEYMKGYQLNKGDRVLIYLDNSVEYIIAFFSILLINAIIVPINKNTGIDNIQHIVNATIPKLIVSNKTYLKRIQDKIVFESCQAVDVELILQEQSCGDLDLIGGLTAEDDLPALILYTSGTTRMPKGVTLTHKNLMANTASILQYLRLTPEDSILATINFSYSYGNSLLLTHTKIGGTIHIENRVSYPVKILEQLYSSKATGFSTVGSYINLLLKQESIRESHLLHLRYITFAGESTSFEDIIKLHALAPHLEIFVMYGQTEASARLSYLEPSMLFKKPGSIGKGIPGVRLRVVNEDGEDVSSGEVGEITAFGENIMRRYWNNEEETKSTIRNGWLYTGDLATVDEDGYIYVKGRKDDVIKYLGHRISPVEIEEVINSFGKVLESAVIGIETHEGNQIKAFIVPKSEIFDKEDIAAHIKRLLPAFKRPHVIELVQELPRTSNGKIKRSELRKVSS